MGKTLNASEIDNYIIKMIVAKYKELQINLPKYLKQFIYSEYYDKYQPSEFYERQYRIIDAIMVSNIRLSGTTVSMEIYLDPDKAKYNPSVWYNQGTGLWSPIQGDSAETVFGNIKNGIHGSHEFGVTDGDFWQSFVDSVNHGGIYDLFVDFKKYLSSTAGLTIK
jgi:hypothetical protein